MTKTGTQPQLVLPIFSYIIPQPQENVHPLFHLLRHVVIALQCIRAELIKILDVIARQRRYFPHIGLAYGLDEGNVVMNLDQAVFDIGIAGNMDQIDFLV